MNSSTLTLFSRFLFVLSIVLYILSLFLPAFAHDRGNVPGTEALALGWFPAAVGVVALLGGDTSYFGTISWLANPLMLVVWCALFVKSRPHSIVASIAALCFSSLFFLVHTINIPDGHSMFHVHAGRGCFLWMGSMLIGLLAALILQPAKSDDENPNEGIII